MIPRIEQKLEISKNQYLDILKWIKFKKGTVLYPERKICSRYFENNNLQMYWNTLEGIVPRKKIRIRTYGSEKFILSKSDYSLEIKMTTEYKRFKKTIPNINLDTLLVRGYLDKLYGLCKELVDISYVREYFLVDDIRITIDREINYKLIDLNKRIQNNEFEEESFVLEIKANIDTNLSFLANNFDFPRSRFSKYERAIQSLLKI
tara:strand:+ start:138 stop:752 length:615 start_codon:yes stop_codon:yes gene_type:complete